ncbi:MAG TPA: isoprenylcysteine carboxylmethyltransferase family protein [Sphingomicrobium sp.]|nr:isoprenylcysteine carboxylmethyltransferase family protein [Sphingomicrobium sp.]
MAFGGREQPVQIDQDSPRVRFPPPLIYLGALLLGVGFDELIGARAGLARLHGLGLVAEVRIWPAIAALSTGVVIALLATGSFRRAGTDVKPWRSSTTLVTDGPFRWTRNPMYLGMSLIYIGLALAADSLAALLLLVPVLIIIQTQVIVREERYLEGKFGDEYRAYKARVRRWL